MTSTSRSWTLTTLTACALAACALSACSDDTRSAGGDSNTPHDAGGSVNPRDAGPAPTEQPDLYTRLGGKDGLESFVQDVVETRILTDSDLKTYFFNQVATPIPAGHPSASQIVVCFARLIGAALEKDTYPGAPVNDPANPNTVDFTCRDMVASHRGTDTQLNIGGATFDKFIGHIADALIPLVKEDASQPGEISQAEFDALAAALVGQKSAVTTEGAPAGPAPYTAP